MPSSALDNMDQPNIPAAHFCSELKRAMEEVMEYSDSVERLNTIRFKSSTSRPWSLILEAYENHDRNEKWLMDWCRNCLPIL